MELLTLRAYGADVPVSIHVGQYADNDNLAVMLHSHEDGVEEPWSFLTVNFNRLDKNLAYIDVNNNGLEILDWIEANGLGKPTGRVRKSGFVAYPEYAFNEEILRKWGGVIYDEYLAQFKKKQELKNKE